ESGKRRVPYALRACDACRKRKGKCCGRQPCEYCAGRNQSCHFSPFTGEWRPGAVNIDPIHHEHSGTGTQPSAPPAWTSECVHPSYSALGSLGELVANLQGQIDSLKAQVRNSHDVNSSAREPSLSSTDTLVGPSTGSQAPDAASDLDKVTSKVNQDSTLYPLGEVPVKHVTRSHFYGPTSPDFGLNVAQIKLRQGSFSGSNLDSPNLASIDENQTDDEDPSGDDAAGEQGREAATNRRMTNPAVSQRLLQFRNFFVVREAVRLLLVYQEVVGQYHPILDVDMLVKQVEWWYSWPRGQQPSGLTAIDETSLLIANLAMAIALCIECTSPKTENCSVRDKIYAGCRELINAKIMSPNPSLKHVIIMLLVGIFHFYRDVLRYAWRISKEQWTEYAIITTSIIVLDRQWSAATGLPTHFSNTDFDLDLKNSIKSPYLKGMMAFILISDKFSEPSSRVANGGAYEDDDEFDIMNFQIEQWRKKAVGSYGFQQIRAGQSPSGYPPAWAILLDLRANAVRELLLRPFFFSNTSAAASRRNIQPGLRLITDSIDVLSTLDKTTEIYRQHHPCFQHILATSCALLFLIVVYVEQNRASLGSDLPEGYGASVSRNFKNAYSLASTYSKSSRASKRLWKRLVLMKKLLIDAGLLRAD
ncbi:hypothetical protein GQ53DRAFT_619835, partial [Thozetella sp. PMI_491]